LVPIAGQAIVAKIDVVALQFAIGVAISGTLVMDLEDLRTFVDVADAGGVSSAARRLGVSKSIVSRRFVPAGS
jgi:hypothetical protein